MHQPFSDNTILAGIQEGENLCDALEILDLIYITRYANKRIQRLETQRRLNLRSYQIPKPIDSKMDAMLESLHSMEAPNEFTSLVEYMLPNSGITTSIRRRDRYVRY